jgi:O-antigen ligase
MKYPDFKKIESKGGVEISNDLISAVFVIFLVGMFLIYNYFLGFNLAFWFLTLFFGAIISFFYPRAGFYAIIFLTFIFERFFTLIPVVLGRDEIKLYPIDILLLAILLGIGWQFFWGKITYTWNKVDWLILIFSLLAGIYFFVSIFIFKGETALAFSSAKQYGFYSLLYFVAAILISSKKYFKELATIIFTGATFIIGFIIYGILFRHGLWSDFTPLSTEGIRTLAFTHGYYICMAFILGLIYVAHKNNLFARFLIILLPIWAIGIVGSMMRHLWISLFMTIFLLILLFAKDNRDKIKNYAKKYAIILFSLLIFFMYSVALFPQSYLYDSAINVGGVLSTRITSIANTEGDESIAWRSVVWQQAAKEYMAKPFFGIGFGKKVSVEIANYHDFVEVRNMHNSFLVLLVQMGMVGFLLLLFSVIFATLGVLRRAIVDEDFRIAAYACLGILVFQLTAFLFQPYLEANLLGIFFWINLGMLKKIGDLKL